MTNPLVAPRSVEGTVITNGRTLPLVLSPTTVDATPADRLAYVMKEKDQLFHLVAEHGAVLLRGWGACTPQNFSDMTTALDVSGHFDMSCSAGPRTELARGVFTANEAPPSDSIPFHHEMAQCDSPPAFVCFYCDAPAVKGGATPLVSSHAVASFLRAEHPEPTAKLAALGVRYVRVLPENTDASNALGKSWKITYDAGTVEEAEQAMRAEGTEWSWHPGGFLRTVSKAQAAITTHFSGQEVFFAAAETTFKSGNLPVRLDSASKSIQYGDGTDLDDATVTALMEAGAFMESNKTRWTWQAGDALIINNGTVLHARDTFTPPRRILASLFGTLDRSAGLRPQM